MCNAMHAVKRYSCFACTATAKHVRDGNHEEGGVFWMMHMLMNGELPLSQVGKVGEVRKSSNPFGILHAA